MKGETVYGKDGHVFRILFQKFPGHFQDFVVFLGSKQNISLLADGFSVKRLDVQESVVINKCRVCFADESVCITGHGKDVGDGVPCCDPFAYIDAFLVSFFTVQKLCLGYLEIQVFWLHR